MTPKSRLYSLVRNWSNKPQQSVRDMGLHTTYKITEAPGHEQIAQWSKAQDLSFELILDTQNNFVEAAIMQPSQDTGITEVIRLFNEGVRAASYWHSFAKPTPLIFPIKAEWLMSTNIMTGIQNALYNCHLPIGLIQIGLIDRANDQEQLVLQDALIRLHRMGILLHLMNFEGHEEDCRLLHEHPFTHVHITHHLIRQAIPGSLCEKKLAHLNKMIHEFGYKSVASGIKLLHDKTVAKKHGLDCYFGSHIMPAMTLHQVIKLSHHPMHKPVAKSLLKKKS